jgi:hypothetical protein
VYKSCIRYGTALLQYSCIRLSLVYPIPKLAGYLRFYLTLLASDVNHFNLINEICYLIVKTRLMFLIRNELME